VPHSPTICNSERPEADCHEDIIISGGENISSIEVEDALYRYPAVLEAAVSSEIR
jgi:acyl-CoA synthetase (AMP-forming)/AMP-acid ligase II